MAEKRRRGRPVLPAAEKKSHNMTFRARGDLRAKIAARAAASGRSMAEEIEFMLNKLLIQEEWSASLAAIPAML